MIFNYILAAILFVIGILTFLFSTLQIILTLTVTLPLCRKSKEIYGKDFDYYEAKVMAFRTICINITISCIVTSLVLFFGNTYAIYGYFIGFVFGLFISSNHLSPKYKDNFEGFYTSVFLKCYRGDPENLK